MQFNQLSRQWQAKPPAAGRRFGTSALKIIKDARLFRETLGADMLQAEQRVGARLDAALRQTYGRRSFDAALSSDRATMMREIRDQLREEADGLGIEIVDVRVRRTDLSENVLEQTYGRMRSERNALAQDIRSQGESTKTRMNAETDRTVTEKLAQAKKEAEKAAEKAKKDAEKEANKKPRGRPKKVASPALSATAAPKEDVAEIAHLKDDIAADENEMASLRQQIASLQAENKRLNDLLVSVRSLVQSV